LPLDRNAPEKLPSSVSIIRFVEEHREVDVVCDGQTLLEASLAAGIQHYHVCGGLAQCSTCRVTVIEGLEALGEPTAAEIQLASKRRWPATMRLACQCRPIANAKVRRVIADDIDADMAAHELAGWPVAEERDMALLFCDIQAFTRITEHQLAYDVVHSLNRFFKQMGDPILANGGTINKYMGDRLLALFGIDDASREDCSRRAIRASLRMLAAAGQLNSYLLDRFGFVLEPRIGLHFGRILMGQMGHPENIELTVIGDSVNMASRIEEANKRQGTRLLASEDLVAPILDSLDIGKTIETKLRGRRGKVRLFEIRGLREIDPVQRVQTTFEQLMPHADAFAKSFYRHLFELEPKLRPLFTNTDMVVMRRMLMRMIGLTVRCLPEVFPQLMELGARHVDYGVKPEYYPIARNALLQALREHLGADFVPEVENAWHEIFNMVRNTMLKGASTTVPAASLGESPRRPRKRRPPN
jgi:class 3 adenylate cyclase/hemoglobin-like flavoprotein